MGRRRNRFCGLCHLDQASKHQRQDILERKYLLRAVLVNRHNCKLNSDEVNHRHTLMSCNFER